MIRVALKGLAARRLRTALTALAIVLGVAMVSAAFTITDTMRGAADSLSSAAYDGTDAVVTARTAFEVDASDWTAKRPTVDGAPAATRSAPSRAWPSPPATSPTRPRSSSATASPPATARTSASASTPRTPGAERLTPFRLDGGRWAAGRGEVVIDAATAEDQGYARRLDRADHHARRARTSSRSSAPRASAASSRWAPPRRPCSTCAAAQKLFGRGDQVDGILVAGARRRAAGASCAPTSPTALPDAQVTTAAEQDRFTLDGLEQFISIIRIALLVFGGVAILVGAFTIFNTLSITVAQRTRELGLLRMVGAARRQVLGSVLVEALAHRPARLARRAASPASGWRRRSTRCSTRWGSRCPRRARCSRTRTIVVSLLVGTLVTLVAGLMPGVARDARRARRGAARGRRRARGRVRLPARAVRGAGVAARPPGAGGRRRGGRARAAQRDAPARPHDDAPRRR